MSYFEEELRIQVEVALLVLVVMKGVLYSGTYLVPISPRHLPDLEHNSVKVFIKSFAFDTNIRGSEKPGFVEIVELTVAIELVRHIKTIIP